MNPIKKQARFAGLLYFLLLITAPIGLVYVPNVLFVHGNATATADHIRASELLLRIGITSELFHQVVTVFLTLALFKLFRGVNEMLAWQVVILGALIPVPIVFLNVIHEIASLILVSGDSFLSVFNKGQLDALAMLFFRLHGQGINVAGIFWGLWLIPFGLLCIRCGFIPRILGILLLIAGGSYVIDCFTSVLLPRYEHGVDSVAGILELGELPIIFFLLIWGATGPLANSALSSDQGSASPS